MRLITNKQACSSQRRSRVLLLQQTFLSVKLLYPFFYLAFFQFSFSPFVCLLFSFPKKWAPFSVVMLTSSQKPAVQMMAAAFLTILLFTKRRGFGSSRVSKSFIFHFCLPPFSRKFKQTKAMAGEIEEEEEEEDTERKRLYCFALTLWGTEIYILFSFFSLHPLECSFRKASNINKEMFSPSPFHSYLIPQNQLSLKL